MFLFRHTEKSHQVIRHYWQCFIQYRCLELRWKKLTEHNFYLSPLSSHVECHLGLSQICKVSSFLPPTFLKVRSTFNKAAGRRVLSSQILDLSLQYLQGSLSKASLIIHLLLLLLVTPGFLVPCCDGASACLIDNNPSAVTSAVLHSLSSF